MTPAARRPADVQRGPGIFGGEAETGVEPDEGEALGAVPSSSGRRLVVEADGGSRGNPGPAAYGAVVRDAATGDVLVTEGLTIGVATNNVAEYSGLIAGLEMVRILDPGAEVEVRMDSKLVVEQMAGRWKVKHPSMIPLARRASALRPARVNWTWVPREQNKAADALVNLALDGSPVRRELPGMPSK
ncbi:MAG TPA: reverse transcriptase-like protein [Propionibacteriaceae bacterium]|nr:reverse transcriptase-like protein [Propionibacteriaceae bacterium]